MQTVKIAVVFVRLCQKIPRYDVRKFCDMMYDNSEIRCTAILRYDVRKFCDVMYDNSEI